ncbi:MAG: bacillithiol biosynthesis protein BshC, partial [Longimicrobiales bacterium]
AEYLAAVRQHYRPEASASDAFVGLLRVLLSGTAIGFVDSAAPALKSASVPLLARELERAEVGEQTLVATTAALEAEGYKPQVMLRPGGVNLFVGTEEGRTRVFRKGKGFRLGPEGPAVSEADLVKRLKDDPADFSPNVLLRPVLESALIPTLTYVGGPGELAYFGQLGDFFGHHEVGAPVATPRASFDVAEAKTLKVLDKFDLSPAEIGDVDRLLSQRAREALPADVVQALERWRETIRGLSDELAAAAARVDSTLEGATESTRNRSYAALTRLEKKLVRAVKRQNQTMARQIRAANAHLWPAGKPQERILNPLHFLGRYGPDFTSGVLEEIQVELGVETG